MKLHRLLDHPREYIALILFGLTFESCVMLIARNPNLKEFFTPAWLAILIPLLGLAAYRGGRAVTYNYIFEWLRAPFTKIVDDSSGAGKSTEADGVGLWRVIGELLCCPICSSTWVALVLVSLLLFDFSIGLVMCLILAAAGVAEILTWRSERDEWQGRHAREQAGRLNREQMKSPAVVMPQEIRPGG